MGRQQCATSHPIGYRVSQAWRTGHVLDLRIWRIDKQEELENNQRVSIESKIQVDLSSF